MSAGELTRISVITSRTKTRVRRCSNVSGNCRRPGDLTPWLPTATYGGIPKGFNSRLSVQRGPLLAACRDKHIFEGRLFGKYTDPLQPRIDFYAWPRQRFTTTLPNLIFRTTRSPLMSLGSLRILTDSLLEEGTITAGPRYMNF